MNQEQQRLSLKAWKKWGPYLSERQWGTVREDYSPMGSAWDYFPHDQARSRAYRWGEDGIGGIGDDKLELCFSWAFWNHKDAILKERIFGLNAEEGNHGEDVKELYYYLDSTPTHSYMKMLYKYPIQEFPYSQLVQENGKRTTHDPEFEIYQTGIFDQNNYFDIFMEYAKESPEDILLKATIYNRSSKAAPITILPTIWYRNTWSFGESILKPSLFEIEQGSVQLKHPNFNDHYVYFDHVNEIVFCDNDTNAQRLYGMGKANEFYKDGINDYIVEGNRKAVNPARTGTKASGVYRLGIGAGQHVTVCVRISPKALSEPFENFEKVFQERKKEADEFYEIVQHYVKDPDLRNIQRQAYAGMMWSKQYYGFNIQQWLEGDPGHPTPDQGRKYGRNTQWKHLHHEDIISMPDKWEYPWYAAWDLAFHCIPIARIDAQFAKDQLLLLLKERCLHPNGQIPAYEWAFGDVNPPVHAWAVIRVFQMDKKIRGDHGDLDFLEQAFHKLLLNFTWWVNRKDDEGNNIFEGGFLGLDNIGVFDRGAPLPQGYKFEQADGTSWMAMYSLNMLRICMELTVHKPNYEHMTNKFFEHFMYIAGAMNNIGNHYGLWDEQDGFYYDIIHHSGGSVEKMKVRSMVGLIPLFAVEVLKEETLACAPGFMENAKAFFKLRPDLAEMVTNIEETGAEKRRLVSLVRGDRMKKILRRMLDETEFLSDYGVRALSKYYKNHPYHFTLNGREYQLKYLPGESDFREFGANSNWRGPIWFPMNYLVLVSLIRYHQFYGDDFKMEYPTGSGKELSLKEIAIELSERMMKIFTKDEKGHRAVFNNSELLQKNPEFSNHILFYEYFHGDSGRGVGASHQTGWTGLIAEIIHKYCEYNQIYKS